MSVVQDTVIVARQDKRFVLVMSLDFGNALRMTEGHRAHCACLKSTLVAALFVARAGMDCEHLNMPVHEVSDTSFWISYHSGFIIKELFFADTMSETLKDLVLDEGPQTHM